MILTVGGNQQIGSIEDVQQAVHLVYQHIACTRSHKELDSAYTAFIQFVKLGIVIVCCSEIA